MAVRTVFCLNVIADNNCCGKFIIIISCWSCAISKSPAASSAVTAVLAFAIAVIARSPASAVSAVNAASSLLLIAANLAFSSVLRLFMVGIRLSLNKNSR